MNQKTNEKNSIVIIFTIVALLLIPIVIAANDPGHDILYIEQNGDSELNGSFNVTNNVSLKGVTSAGVGLTIYGNGYSSSTGTIPYISGGSGSNLYLETPSSMSIYLKYNGGGAVYIGALARTDLNVSGALYLNGSNNKLDTGPAVSASSLNLYWGDKLLCNTSVSNCGWATTATGGGDILSVQSDNIYIYNGSNTGDVYLRFNESKLNATIEAKISSGSGNISGAGTSGTIAKFTGDGTIGNSIISESGNTLTIAGNISMPASFYIGSSAAASGQDAIAIGTSATASNNNALAIGRYTDATTDSAIAIGNSAQATGGGGIAIGGVSVAAGYAATAIGLNANASANYAVAIGYGVVNDVANSTKFGGAIYANGNVNLTTYNVSAVNCIVFDTGGKICSGA